MFQNTKRESIGFMAFFLDVNVLTQRLSQQIGKMEQEGGLMLLGGDSLIYSGSNGNAPQDTAAFVQAAGNGRHRRKRPDPDWDA